jgi:SPP1 gp7 family putative phage head morphogenesis protein
MPVAINANTQLYDKVIDRAAMIRLYERRVSGKVDLVIDGHTVRVDKLIKEAKLSDKGFATLQDAIEHETTSTFKKIYSTSSRSLLDLFADQASFAYQNVEAAMSKIWRTEKPNRRIAEDVVLNQPLYNNQTLAQGWASVSIAERKRLEGVIRKGIANGDTVEQIALAVRTGNVFNITRMQSKALVVTSITSVQSQADHQVYKANEPALTGWQYVAVLDSRTTNLCAYRDGTIYPISDTEHLPPAHFNCRSTTIPVFKSWSQIGELDGVAAVRQRNIQKLTFDQKAFYDGLTPLKESYNDWLKRQPEKIQLKHLGDYDKVEMLNQGSLTVDAFSNPEGNSLGIKELRLMTDVDTIIPGDTVKFANAKEKLDAIRLGASTADDLVHYRQQLGDYYVLQAGDLNGTLSTTNYRGTLLYNKKATRNRVLAAPPTEEQLRYNPMTGRYDDVRIYQPNNDVLDGALRRINDSDLLQEGDKALINNILDDLKFSMGLNERSVVAENLRIIIGRYRTNPVPWGNLKAVIQGQIKFDIMNVSDSIETVIRRDQDVLKKLAVDNYIDPVLGHTQLDTISKEFHSNIIARNTWEDRTAPLIAAELRDVFDTAIPFKIRSRLSDEDLRQFYLRFAKRLGMADSPDRDAFAVSLGRDLYNLSNRNGTRRDWYELGTKLLEKKAGHLFQIDTFGFQKRRMKSRLSGQYFGPYYETLSFYINNLDPRITEYSKLVRKVELGLRVAVTNPEDRLVFREGYKTYFIDRGKLGYLDTRIPITSTNSFSDFPVEFVDKPLVDALNWASQTEYKVDPDFYDFTKKLLYFTDDKGKSEQYNDLNHYRKYIITRGDAYERFKAMDWLRNSGKSFSNNPFIDHRARIYDRGLISPQSGETFRPFLNTKEEKSLGIDGFNAFNDQIGAFLGGLSDYFEGDFDGLTFSGRRQIADKWRPDLIKLGNAMLRAKPADIRFILESDIAARVDGEELGKFYRLAIESAKIDNHVEGVYNNAQLFDSFKTGLAMEQDASSSGAQIIALTTRNRQLAELSNVVPTNQKRRLYDEIAASTYNDPRFKVLNEKLNLSLKDLQKAAKAQNMVTFYGAGERTGILNVEGKLAKVLNKDSNTLVVTAGDRQKVLEEISARIARVERYDPDTAADLLNLRNQVKDIFNKGMDPGDEIMEQLWFLDPKTKDLVEKLSNSYDKVVTPDDFKTIAKIMSGYLKDQVPILSNFVPFFGRLAQSFLANAKPSDAQLDWKVIAKMKLLGSAKKGYTLPPLISQALGIKASEPVSEKVLKRFGFWKPDGMLSELFFGVKTPTDRAVNKNLLKIEIPIIDKKIVDVNLLEANKNALPKSWTTVPWVNFDGKIIEQNFTQSFEERIVYKDKQGNWVTNILMVPQKTEASYIDELFNKDGKINDIADGTRARTAFAVNGNHSNDAVIVKKFHLWGKKAGISTSTIHDAFFTNIADMLKGRTALRGIYADVLKNNVVKTTLDEMLARGLPKDVYDQYLNEAIDTGLIPVAGRSVVGGKILTQADILTADDILVGNDKPYDFENNTGFYGVG